MTRAACLRLLLLHLLLNAGPVDGTAAAVINNAAAAEPDGAAVELGRLRAELVGSPARPALSVDVVSSDQSCVVRVDGRMLLHRQLADSSDTPQQHQLGLHALALNPRTGRVTGHAFAPSGVPAGAFVDLASFIAGVQRGRVLVLCQLAEAEMALDERSGEMFRSLNASFATDMQARSALALIAVKGGAVLAEGYRPHLAALISDAPPPSLRLAASVPADMPPWSACQPPSLTTAAERRRQEFCEQYDGYGALCDCEAPPPPPPPGEPRPLADGTLFPFPVVVVARGRPRHLYRCLGSLLANRGIDPAQIFVIGGGSSGDDGNEQRDLLRVLGVAWHLMPARPDGSGGSLHRSALEIALRRFPDASKLLVLEDSVEVSPDFLSFFQQTHGVLDADVSLYGVSAGNELGYRHAVGDRTQVYRVDTAPAGAWLLTRRLVSDELLPGWPAAAAAAAAGGPAEPDLSELLRRAELRRGRDCVVPDVPRFYRFAFSESDNGTDFLYHWDRAVSGGPAVALRGVQELVLPRYRRQLMTLLSRASKLDGSQSPLNCTSIFPANVTGQTFVLSVRMLSTQDSAGWERAASCLGLWDRDARGHHAGVWRFHHADSAVLVLGVPFSPLAGYAMTHGRGRVLLVSGRRSARQRRLGRWPPGRPRPGPARLLSRYQLAAANLGLNRHQLEEALRRRGQLDRDTNASDDGDLRLQDIETA